MDVINIQEQVPQFCLFHEDTERDGMLISANQVFTFYKTADQLEDKEKKYIFVDQLAEWVSREDVLIMTNFYPN